MLKIVPQSCVVNFSFRLWEPLKKHLTSKRCPLRRTLDQSSTTQPDQEMETSLPEVADSLLFLLCEPYFVPVINFELQLFRLSFFSFFPGLRKADFSSQWVKTNIEWTGPQPTHCIAVEWWVWQKKSAVRFWELWNAAAMHGTDEEESGPKHFFTALRQSGWKTL